MTNYDNRRNVSLDWLKVLAIFLVVFYHSTLYSSDFFESPSYLSYFYYFFKSILGVGVPIFFFVNGYLLFSKKFILKEHIKKTFRYFLITIFWGMVTTLLISIFLKSEDFSFRNILNSFFTLKVGYTNHLWFMTSLINIYLLFPLLKSVFDNQLKVFLYFVILCFFLTFGITFFHEVGYLIFPSSYIDFFEKPFLYNINPFSVMYGYSYVYFCFGGLFYYYRDNPKIKIIKEHKIILIFFLFFQFLLLFLFGIKLSFLNHQIWDSVYYGYNTIFTFFSVLSIFLLLSSFSKRIGLLESISKNTFGIYFIHWILIVATKPFLLSMVPISYRFLFTFLYSFGILFLSFFISYFFKKVPIFGKILFFL